MLPSIKALPHKIAAALLLAAAGAAESKKLTQQIRVLKLGYNSEIRFSIKLKEAQAGGRWVSPRMPGGCLSRLGRVETAATHSLGISPAISIGRCFFAGS
ncbi:MAG: hypothetical protein K9K88_06400 [Desulfobacterales bacterium]|nr:hypothetical protein [Desulfobacterales bacterium]